MPDSTVPSAVPPSPASAESERDPLASLHKMSTTAGLGSQDYVAINSVSIVSILLGLASALVMLSKILLILPLAGIICGIVAWVQIRRSNGTQTGLILAIGGIVLSIGLAGYAIGMEATAYWRGEADRQQIVKLIDQFSGIVQNADTNPASLKEAYQLFDQTFQQRESEASFISRWKSLQNTLGAIKSFRWNGANLPFDTDPATGDPTAAAQVIIEFKDPKNPEGRYTMTFRKTDNVWKVDNFPILFPEQPPGGPGGPGAPGAPHAH
jgi:hypothetical protein